VRGWWALTVARRTGIDGELESRVQTTWAHDAPQSSDPGSMRKAARHSRKTIRFGKRSAHKQWNESHKSWEEWCVRWTEHTVLNESGIKDHSNPFYCSPLRRIHDKCLPPLGSSTRNQLNFFSFSIFYLTRLSNPGYFKPLNWKNRDCYIPLSSPLCGLPSSIVASRVASSGFKWLQEWLQEWPHKVFSLYMVEKPITTTLFTLYSVDQTICENLH
jgi:hypothetical protein